MSRFFHVLSSTVPRGPDVGFSLHAADQHADWPAIETVESHVKFSNEESPAMWPLV